MGINLAVVKPGAFALVCTDLSEVKEELLKSGLEENDIRKRGLVATMSFAKAVKGYINGQYAKQAQNLSLDSTKEFTTAATMASMTAGGEVFARWGSGDVKTQLTNFDQFKTKMDEIQPIKIELTNDRVNQLIAKNPEAFDEEFSKDEVAAAHSNGQAKEILNIVRALKQKLAAEVDENSPVISREQRQLNNLNKFEQDFNAEASNVPAGAAKFLEKDSDAFTTAFKDDDIAYLKAQNAKKMAELVKDHETALNKLQERIGNREYQRRQMVQNQIIQIGTGGVGGTIDAQKSAVTVDEGQQIALKTLVESVQNNNSTVAQVAGQAQDADMGIVAAMAQVERAIMDANYSFRG